MIYGFFEQLRTIIKDGKVWTHRLALCFDSKKSYRKKALKTYKANRHQNRTEEELEQREIMDRQINMLARDYLRNIGFRIFKQKGLESDDLMAQLAWQIRHSKSRRAVIVTGDMDLCQCIHEHVHWYDPGRGVYYNPLSFQKKKRIKPHAFATVKAIAGCASDDIKGIEGVGEKSAIDFIRGELPEHYKKYQAIQSEEGHATWKANLPLVVLPHEKTKPIKLKTPEYNPDAFFAMCEDLGMQSYLEGRKYKEWNRIFKGSLK